MGGVGRERAESQRDTHDQEAKGRRPPLQSWDSQQQRKDKGGKNVDDTLRRVRYRTNNVQKEG